MPVFNATTIMAMVDRWRPKTHSFHLPCDEMMVALEDMALILGLLIRGWKKILYVPDAKHGVCISSHVLKLGPLSYNKIGGFYKTVVRKWT
jgi:hypothetical protein